HRNTEKYSVQGHPDLFVRIQRENIDAFEDVQAVLDDATLATRNLRAFGIDVLPAHAFEYHGAACIVTKKVSGETLSEALAAVPDDALFDRVDQIWTGLSLSAIDGYENDGLAPDDAYDPGQYMLGTIADDPMP